MSIAVVFDSAGTLLRTFRVTKDVAHGTVEEGVETITLTFSCEERALVVLYLHSMEIIREEPEKLLSDYLREHMTGFGIACACKAVTAQEIQDLLHNDRRATVGDLQVCIRKVWESCKKESIVALNSGVVVNRDVGGIEFVVTSGGRPFTGARSTIRDLQKMGAATYIASGDRTNKLLKMADYLGVPQDNVYGLATPAIKEQVVDELRRQFDTVVMVGDGINDLRAMKRADFAVLSLQQTRDKPAPLFKTADYVVESVRDVVEIVRSLS